MKRPPFPAIFALAFLASGAGCAAASRVVANEVAGTASGSTYAEDDDPELVRAAVPFGLKTMEGLLADHPRHEGLLTSLASGYTQYAYAFVQADADAAELDGKATAAQALRLRARKLYVRARDYGLRGLEQRHEGLARLLLGARDLGPALAELGEGDLPLVYWTAASWALAISAGKDDMALVAQLPSPEALMRRALAIDEAWQEGAIHEFLLAWDAARGGAADLVEAQRHLERVQILSRGRKLSPLVSYAESVLVARQDRAEFTRVLQQVLAFDVDSDRPHRLANVLAQRRARLLLARADDLFT